MKKRTIVIGSVVFLVGALLCTFLYMFVWSGSSTYKGIYLIPDDAIYIIESKEPIQNWSKISQSKLWLHLQKNDYFARLTISMTAIDSMLKNNETAFSLVGKRKVIVSAHMTKYKDYDFLYILDLKGAKGISSALLPFVDKLVGESFQVNRREYKQVELLELYDPVYKENLYMAILNGHMLVSYTHSLIEASIDQHEEPVIGRDLKFISINNEIKDEGLFRFYFQYDQLEHYLTCYTNEPISLMKDIGNSLKYSGLYFLMDDIGSIYMRGLTNLNDSIPYYLHALLASGSGTTTSPAIIPQQTSFLLSMGFDDMAAFYESLIQQLKNSPEIHEQFEENLKKVEGYLNISVQEHFVNWVHDELSFVQLTPSGLGKDNEFALVLKTKDIDDAKAGLQYMEDQIRKLTPVKFKSIDYKDYEIRFLSIKGFFKLMLGKMFSKLDKPYYTFIGDYVVFSNHPQCLRRFIDAVEQEETLAEDKRFKRFRKQFEDDLNVLIYINTLNLLPTLKYYSDPATWQDIDRNKDYITCFDEIGFQLSQNDDESFNTVFATSFVDPKLAVLREQSSKYGPQYRNDLDWQLVGRTEEEEMIKMEEIQVSDLHAKLQQEHYSEGELKLQVGIKNGKKHGIYREYYKNGDVKVKGRYKRDEKVGLWKTYDRAGKVVDRQRY